MLILYLGLSCQSPVSETMSPETGKLTLLFTRFASVDADNAYQKLQQQFPEAQIIFSDKPSLVRGLSQNYPDFIPDIAVVGTEERATIFIPATSRDIEIGQLNASNIENTFEELELELSVPQRKQRMVLLSQSTSEPDPALSVYVAAQMRWVEEQLSKHPAIQLAFGGGVHTNVMLDRHVTIESWESLLEASTPWECTAQAGGVSALFYRCQIPSYSADCLKDESSILNDLQRAASLLKKVSLPEELKQSRSKETQAELDKLFISKISFPIARTICTTSGCFLCGAECVPSTAETMYVPLPPHDAAWRFCSHSSVGVKSSICAQLRFEDVTSHPIISLHGDACSEDSPTQ